MSGKVRIREYMRNMREGGGYTATYRGMALHSWTVSVWGRTPGEAYRRLRVALERDVRRSSRSLEHMRRAVIDLGGSVP